MRKELYYEELVTHVPNLMNAYGRFQHQFEPEQTWSLENEIERGQHIYEFTAQLNNTDCRITELQFVLDKMCTDFHCHLSRQLLGNNWRIPKNVDKQPMMVCFFDYEGTKVSGVLAPPIFRFSDLSLRFANIHSGVSRWSLE